MGRSVDAESPLSHEFIKNNILSKGHEIATHGYYHRAQNKIRPIEGIKDIIDCRIALEKAFKMLIRGMAFPDSIINRATEPEAYKKFKNYIEDLEIAYVRSAGADNDKFILPDDWHHWMPTAHHDNPQVIEYIKKFMALDLSVAYKASLHPRLFYLWGHSFEFERKHNWEHLETLCQMLSGKENVWYATNVEIYDYVKAYNSLIYSADGTIVNNPTLIDVWFDVDKTLYLVKSGETITIKP